MANFDLDYEGSEVQDILDTGKSLEDDGYIFLGTATPSTIPGTPTERVAYIGGPGTYNNFGTTVVVPSGSIVAITYNGSAWSKMVLTPSLPVSTTLGSDNTTIPTSKAVKDVTDAINTKLGEGYLYAGIATASTNPGTPTGEVFYLARQAGTYTNFGGLTLTEGVNILKYNGTTWSQEQLISIADIYRNPLMGYYECDTAGGTAAKTVAATGYVLPTTGGSVKIKMANRNTVANATLNINSTGAKPLYYNGQRAGVGNTWDTNEIIEVFYDGTNYQAYNVAGSNGDGVFDISAYNLTDGQPTPYVDLAAALGTDGANVPQSLRKGGMTIKFIQGSVPSSDNKYVQFRLMAQSFTTNEEDWQGVDTEPIPNSRNLVESGGVAAKFEELDDAVFDYAELEVTSFENGYIKTNGDIVEFNGALVLKYSLDGISKVKIINDKRTGNQCLYAFYSSQSFSSSTLLKAGVQGKNSTQDIYIEEVPPGAAYIGISKLGKQKYGVWNFDEKSSSISELEAKVSYNTFAPMDIYSTVQNKYINYAGNLGDGNGFSVIKYQIPANTKKIRIFNDLKTGSSILYDFYSSDDFSSSTAIPGSFGPQASASESSVYIEEVPFGATYIGLSTFSGTGYGVDVVNDKNLNNEVHELSEDIEEINGKLIFEAFDKIDASPIQYGKHISNNGNIVGDESTGFFIIPYQVPNNVKKIRITNKSRMGSFRLYGFYSSDNFSSSTVISGSLGPQANSSESDIYIVDVPYGAEYLVISVYNSDYGAESCYNIGIKAKIDSIETEIAEISDKEEIKRYAYSFDGNNLFIAYYAGNNIEYTYWFKKCMANMLFTFYRVGYRTVNRDYPSTEGIISQDGIIPINSTGSDNIGPIHCVNSAFSEKFVGGNHTVTDDDKTYKTAETKTFNIYCDDKELTSRSDGYADSIYIDVHNTVYDPSVSPVDEDATILTEPLCEEYVCYKICKTTIEVGVSHVYSSTTQNSVDNYYGMQSMFVSEDYIMTPNGIYPDWIPVGDVQHHGHIIKEDYPDFNRFIEKNTANEAYQSTYLYNDFGIGTHRMVRDSEFIFTRGDTGKDYHRMLDEYTGQVNGKVYQWRGSYTFFHIPIIDDNYVLAYMGTIYGKDALFINTKQAFSGVINVPHELTLKELSVRECFGIVDDNNGNAFQLGGNSLYIECENTGSLILVVD